MSEFSDRPLVAGSLFGTRSFSVDSLGRLRGPSFPSVWVPGLNEAKCRRGSVVGRWVHLAAPSLARSVAAMDPAAVEAESSPTHQVASLKCGCGFYAYHDDSDNPYHQPGNVLGIVRGEGVATVGSRGFRCERAEVVALVDPDPAGSVMATVREAWDCWSLFWDRHDGASIPVGVGSVFATAFGIGAAFAGPQWLAILIPLALIGLSVIPASFHGITVRYRSRTAPVDMTLVRRNYPDVPVYRSLDAAVRDFPLSTPPAPSPEDEDFWTRNAS